MPSSVRTWLIRGAVALPCAAIAVVVIVAAIRDSAKEPTFGARPAALPVRVWASPRLLDYAASDLREAVALWNDAAGCEVLRLVDDETAPVTVAFEGEVAWCGRDLEQSVGGATAFCGWQTHVRFRDLSEAIFERLAHELGHALGHREHDLWGILRHDAGEAYVTDRDMATLEGWCGR